jgi:hypothetical protein
MAIPVSNVTHVKLDHTDLVLLNARGEALKTLWLFGALIELRGQSTIDVVYVVEGL